jgi:hypothetical protein
LLLSPSPEELAFTSAVASERHFQAVLGQAPEPTLDRCAKALRAWFKAMEALPAAAAEKSGSFFFFTGHGLELTQEQQILLPSDYLEAGVPDDAISVRNLRNGLGVLRVRDQFFFLDACRNDHQELKDAEIKGRSILQEWKASRTNPDRNVPILYASAAGTQAWAPALPTEGASLFGRALLEGLDGRPDLRLDCDGQVCRIRTYPLHTFVRERVQALLRERGATVRQNVPLSGSVLDDPAVTEIDVTRAGVPGMTPPSRPGFALALPERLPIREGWNPLGPVAITRAPAASFSSHDVFGSEHMTATWEGVRVYSLKNRRWLEAESAYRLKSVRRDDERQVYRLELTIPDPGDHWLEMPVDPWAAAAEPAVFACLLPGDEYGEVVYRLDVDRQNRGPILSLEAGLAPVGGGNREAAAVLWERYRERNAREAADGPDMQWLEGILRSKFESPLAATVAGIVLLRAGRLDLTHDWLRNLSRNFPELPDGPALWLEKRLREAGLEGLEPADLDLFLEIGQRGLPRTGEALGYAARQAEDLLAASAERALPALDPERRLRLQELSGWLRRAVRFFRGGGLFTVLSGPADAVRPALAEP